MDRKNRVMTKKSNEKRRFTREKTLETFPVKKSFVEQLYPADGRLLCSTIGMELEPVFSILL
jgi:hypothetical protein